MAGFPSPLLPLALSVPVVEIQEPPELNLLSIFSQKGVQISFSDPILMPNRRRHILSLTDYEAYTHEIRSRGGYYSANTSFKVPLSLAMEWLTDGVGRHVETYDQAQEMIWEGFVDKVTLSIGRLEYVMGPLISQDIGNKVRIRYSVVDYSIAPPSVGVTLTSAYANNLASQNRYGIIQRTLSANEITETTASNIRDSWINEHASPRLSVRSSFLNNTEATLTVDCLGYWHYLDTWNYSNPATGGSTITEKITQVMDSSVNSGLFSEDYGFIDDNSLEVKTYEGGDKTPMSIMSELATYGDTSDSRYNLGFGPGRKLYYTVMPAIVEYYQHFDGSVYTLAGQELYPWNVQPGKWILYAGLLPVSNVPFGIANLRANPACAFIEAVTFSTPYNVDISTAFVSKLDQLFARMGMSGI